MTSVAGADGGLEISDLMAAFGSAGVTTFRYPGGTVTETVVDVAPYGEPVVIEPTEFVREDGSIVQITNVADFFTAARLHFAGTGADPQITFVVPTSGAYSGDPAPLTHDGTIDVGRPINEAFIQDAVGYVRYAIQQAFANGITIHQFELGNEFFVPGAGNMTAREYGVVAGRLMQALVNLFKEPEISAILDIWDDRNDFIVQGVHHSAGGNFNSDWANVSIMQGLLDVDMDNDVVGHINGFDPPPPEWSSAMFRKMEETHGKQATEARRDCHEVTAG